MRPRNVDPGFPDRLQRMLREKGMSQSDLARKLFGTIIERRKDGSEYEVPKNRQTISKYLSRRAYPSEDTKQKLADAFEVPLSLLFPMDDPTNRSGSGIVLSELNRRECILEVKVKMPTALAREIIEYLKPYAR